MKNFNLIRIVIFTFCLVLMLPGASAISVNGAKFMGNIAPGGTAVHSMILSTNADEQPSDIQIDVYGFGQRNDQSYTILDATDDTNPYSARPYITLSANTVHLEPGIPKTVNATISLPSNIGKGGRYALIYIHTIAEPGKTFTTAVLIPVLVTIQGTSPTLTGSIADVSVGQVTIGQPITVTTTFKNTGDYHYYYTVNAVTISDANGNVIGNISTVPSDFAIIPGNTVQYIARPELKDLAVGTYTANSRILLGEGTVLDEKTITFSITKPYVPPVTESSITLSPSGSGTLTSPDGRISILFPQGAVMGETKVTLKPFARENLRAAPAKAKIGATSFEVTGLTGLLSKAATVKVIYSSDDLAAAGGDPSQLKLSYWDPAQSKWTILPTQVDARTTTLTANSNYMGVWAVMASSSTSGASPGTTYSPVPMTVILGSLVIAVVIGAGYRGGKRR